MFKIFRRSETKSFADPSPDLLSLFGITPTAAGVAVSSEAALRVPAVSSAIRLISEATASLEVKVKRIGADGTEADDPGSSILGLLRDQANDWTDGFSFIRDLVIDALSDDRGGLAFVNRIDGRPVELIRYRAGIMSVDYEPDTGEPSYRISGRVVRSQDVIHLRSPFGRAPLSLAREAIGLAIVMERHGSNLFGSGARPSGVLSFPKGMGEESVKKAREAWRKTHEGGETGRTAILYDGASFTPLQLTSTDSQFLENRQFQITEIARAFRVPPSMLFQLDRATWSNSEQMGQEFLTYSLEPWLRALEGALRRALFLPDERPRMAIRFDRDDLTRADLTARATAINSLIASRTINPNEGRDWLGLAPYQGGEEFFNPNISTSGGAAVARDPEDKEQIDNAD